MSCLRRVRTADGRRVVDVTDWCRIDHLAPEELPAIAEGSIYARARGARPGGRPRRRAPDAAQRRRRARAPARRAARRPCCSRSTRSTAPPTASPCSSRASTTSPTRSRSRSCGAARARRSTTDGPLVVGVDVGSQGTCAQALEPDGTLVGHELRAARAAATRTPAGRSRTPRVDGRARRHAGRGAGRDGRPRDRRALLRLPARRARGGRRRRQRRCIRR